MNHFHQTEFLRGVHGIRSLLITESVVIRIDYNLARVYYFTHTTLGPCNLPNRPKLNKGTRVNRSQHGSIIEIFTPILRVET